MEPKPGRKKAARYGATGLYITVPTLMAASIVIGFLIGNWADKKLHTEPYLMLVGLGLGFAAAVREIYHLIKRAQQMENEEEDTR
jgi:F0F1-type ATP synthase assembly protein I